MKNIICMVLVILGSKEAASAEDNLCESRRSASFTKNRMVVPSLSFKNSPEEGFSYVPTTINPSPRTVSYIISLLESGVIYPVLNDKNQSIILTDMGHKNLILCGLQTNALIMTKSFSQLENTSLYEYRIQNDHVTYNFYFYTLKKEGVAK